MADLVPWQQILADALDHQEIVGVAATARAFLGRKPTRSEITSARRAALRYAAAGNAKAVRLPSTGTHGQHRLLLVWPQVDTSDLARLREAANARQLPSGVKRSLVGNTRAARALVVTLIDAARSADEVEVNRLTRTAARLLADDLAGALSRLGQLQAALNAHAQETK